MAAFARFPSPSPSLHLSSTAFRNLVTEDDVPEIYELLIDHPELLPRYMHFSSISRTLKRLEQVIRLTQHELDMAYTDMENHDFHDAFSFFIARKQNERRRANPLPQPSYRLPTPVHAPQQAVDDFLPPPYSPQPRRPLRSTPFPRNDTIPTYCMSCGEHGHSSTTCTLGRCLHCNGRHTFYSCPRRQEHIILPSGVRVSPTGQLLQDESDTLPSRPFPQPRVSFRHPARSSSFRQ